MIPKTVATGMKPLNIMISRNISPSEAIPPRSGHVVAMMGIRGDPDGPTVTHTSTPHPSNVARTDSNYRHRDRRVRPSEDMGYVVPPIDQIDCYPRFSHTPHQRAGRAARTNLK